MRKNLLWVLAATILVSFAACRSGSEDGTDGASGNKGMNGENGGNGAGAGPEQQKSLDLSFIPEDCFFAMVIHPKRLAESPLAKELSDDVTEELLEEMTRGVGVDPRKMEEVVVLWLPREPSSRSYGPPFDTGLIIRFSEPVANKELLGKMFQHIEFADEQATCAGRAYYRGWDFFRDSSKPRRPPDPKEPADLGIHFPDDRTMVFSEEDTLEKMLSADKVKSGLVERLGRLDADNDLMAVATAEGSGGAFDKLAREFWIRKKAAPPEKDDAPITRPTDRRPHKGPSPEGDAFDKSAEEPREELPAGMRGLREVPSLGHAATLTADLRADPVAKLVVEANDADAAARLKRTFESALIVGASIFAEQSDDIVKYSPPGVGRPLVELVEQTFDAVTVTEDGEKVIGTLKRPEALAKLPGIIAMATGHPWEGRRRWDSEEIDGVCRRVRRDFVEKRFAKLASSVWRDRFVLYSSHHETGQPVVVAFDTAVQVWENMVEAFDEISPHPTSTQFEMQAPVAVIRLPMARYRKGERTSSDEYLAIAARQHGDWRIAAAVHGDWKLTEADRFDPENEDHRKLQAFYDQVNQVMIDEDADRLRDVCHPLQRGISPGTETDRHEHAFAFGCEEMVSYFEDFWKQSDFQKHQLKIVFAKVIGPLALTLAESSQIVDNGPEEKGKCIQFFCRDGDQWKSCLWMGGDWEKIFTAK